MAHPDASKPVLPPSPIRARGAAGKTARWFLGAGLAGLLASVAGIAALARDPHPGLEDSLPVSCGARGSDFEIRCADGLPYLVSNGLPYPTGFDSTDHVRHDLNGAWTMRFDSSGALDAAADSASWRLGDWGEAGIPIEVPSTYNAPHGPYGGHQGVVWFARRFPFDSIAQGTWVRLGFQGVLLRCRVWLNGELLGEREGGYTPFFFEAGSRLKQGGDNVLVVRADNRLSYGSLPPRVRPRHNPVWGVYGGIYRDVYLETLPSAHIAVARVKSYRDSTGSGFAADVILHGPPESSRPRSPGSPGGIAAPACSLTASVRAPDGLLASRASRAARAPPARFAAEAPALGVGETRVLRLRLPVENPRSWRPGIPEVYEVELKLAGGAGEGSCGETVVVRTGFRDITVDGARLRLDGKTLFLKGISKMEDDPATGQTQTAGGMRRDLEMIREMGANYVRLAHYPHHDAEARMARDMGLMLGEEIPYFHVGVGWSQWLVDFQGWGGFPFGTFGMRHLHRKELLLQAQKSLIELIERDGNNPAVILWSLGNESYSLGEAAGRVYGWLRASALAFDPSRPVTMAEMSYYIPLLDGLRATPRFMDVASVNAYYGWYFGEASGAEGHLDRFHARYPGRPVILSEFGAEAALGRADSDGVRTGDRVYFPRTYSEGYQAGLLRAHVLAAWERPYVAGVSPWVFADFHCPWFPHNPVPGYNTKGVVTRERTPKRGYFELKDLYGDIPDFRGP